MSRFVPMELKEEEWIKKKDREEKLLAITQAFGDGPLLCLVSSISLNCISGWLWLTVSLIIEGLQNGDNDSTKEFKILCETLQPYAPALMKQKIHDEKLAEPTRAISTTISRPEMDKEDELTDLLKQVTYDFPNFTSATAVSFQPRTFATKQHSEADGGVKISPSVLSQWSFRFRNKPWGTAHSDVNSPQT